MHSLRAVLVAALLGLPALALLPGPSGAAALVEATVYRDDFGVPHIFADDEYALVFANGYVQAQDRLFEMDLLRHVGRGTSAAVVGPGQLGSDLAARRDLYTEEQRAAKFLAMSAEGRFLLQAYADGVNRATAEMAASGNLPAEFAALSHAPEPWTVLDTVAVADFLLDRFGAGGGDEMGNARLLAHLQATLGSAAGETAFRDAVWGAHPTSYATIPDAEGAFAGPVLGLKDLEDLAPAQAAALEAAKAAVPFGVATDLADLLPSAQAADAAPFRFGSNALLVAPALSRDGRALVGGGPQTGYFNPEVLYEVGLHGAGWDVVGVGVAGAPGVVLGRTGTFAWTVTSGISDETDYIALPAAGARSYLWDGEARDLACREEVHAVATPPALAGLAIAAALEEAFAAEDPEPVMDALAANGPRALVQEICVAQAGPVVYATYGSGGDPAWFFAARKAHRGLELSAAEQWLSIGRATNLQEFRAAFEGFPFTFNFHYAGPEGACYHHVGTQPIRNAALDPRFPTPAGEAWGWQGSVTGAAMPRLCNPAQGYFANWNNLPQRGWSAGDGRELWGSVHRVERLDAEVQKAIAASPDGKLDLADVQAVLREAATRDSLARGLGNAILAHLEPGEAATALAAWLAADLPWRDADADGVYDDLGHAYYDAIRQRLQVLVLQDELGPFTRHWNPDPMTNDDPHAGDHGQHGNKDALLLDALTGAADHAWCDTVGTPALETCQEQVRAAAAAAGARGALGVHLTRFTPIGAGPAYTMPMTNRATYYHFHDPGGDTALASGSGSAIPPGQSGHLSLADLATLVQGGPAPLHMRDQLPLYNAFGLKPVPVSEAQADAVSSAPALVLRTVRAAS